MQGKEPTFEEQAEVITWIEGTKKILDIDPAAKPQPAKPCSFLTHLPYPLVPSGGRRIFCFRDQKDVVISAYRFLDSQFLLRVALPIFAGVWIQSVEHCLKDLLNWWEHHHDDDLVLLL